MPDVNWSTAWTAAVTAGFVTLAVEYVAKPRLEARREEILAALRARREVKALVMQMTMAAQKYGTVLPAGADRGTRAALEAGARPLVRDGGRPGAEAGRRARVYAGTYREPVLSLITDFAFNLHGVLLSSRPRRRQAELIVEFGTAMLGVLDAPAPWKLWRYRRWIRAAEVVRRLVARTSGAPRIGQQGPAGSADGRGKRSQRRENRR